MTHAGRTLLLFPLLLLLLLFLVALAERATAAVAAGGSSLRGVQRVATELQQGKAAVASSDDGVVREAFDVDGTSLGYAHDPLGGWSESKIGLPERDAPYMYHENASY